MIRHIALFRFKEETTDDHIATLSKALDGLPAVIRQIRRYEHGPNLGLSDGNADYAVAADFDSVDDWAVYAADPAHRRVIEDLIQPIVAEATRIQIRLRSI